MIANVNFTAAFILATHSLWFSSIYYYARCRRIYGTDTVDKFTENELRIRWLMLSNAHAHIHTFRLHRVWVFTMIFSLFPLLFFIILPKLIQPKIIWHTCYKKTDASHLVILLRLKSTHSKYARVLNTTIHVFTSILSRIFKRTYLLIWFLLRFYREMVRRYSPIVPLPLPVSRCGLLPQRKYPNNLPTMADGQAWWHESCWCIYINGNKHFILCRVRFRVVCGSTKIQFVQLNRRS